MTINFLFFYCYTLHIITKGLILLIETLKQQHKWKKIKVYY